MINMYVTNIYLGTDVSVCQKSRSGVCLCSWNDNDSDVYCILISNLQVTQPQHKDTPGINYIFFRSGSNEKFKVENVDEFL